jgi:FAD-linked oxidoreductase
MRFENWGRTARCEPHALVQPRDEDELAALLRTAQRESRPVKVVGAGHSFTDIACTDGYQVNLDHMARVISVDQRRQRVTVQAGIRLHTLMLELARHRLSLPVLGSILEQSIAGAISTGTHGSAPHLGNLPSRIVALRIMLADGSVRDLDETQPELLAACRVSLGALGVITRVTLSCVPSFALREVATPMEFDAAAANLRDIIDSAPYIKLWWLPHTPFVQIYRCQLSNAPVPAGPPPLLTRVAQWFDAQIVNARIFEALLRSSARLPQHIVDMNRAVRSVYFRKSDRTGPSTVLLPVAMPPRHSETEYAVPIEEAPAVLRKLREVIDGPSRISFAPRLRVNFPAELRFVAADDAWLSPMYGAPGQIFCCVGAYSADSPDRERYFAEFEAYVQSLGGRPHWGKQFTAPARYLQRTYPKWQDFATLRREWDPAGRFLNPYLRRLFSPEMSE